MINIYGSKIFHVTGPNPLHTSVVVFDFITAGFGGTAVSNGMVFIIATISYKDAADQRGFAHLDQGFRRNSSAISVVGSQFLWNFHGEANFTGNVGYGYDTSGVSAVIMNVDFAGSSPATSTHDIIIESFLVTP